MRRQVLFLVVSALAILTLAGTPTTLMAKKPSKPPPVPEPDPDPAIAYIDGDRLMVMNADGSNRKVVLEDRGTDFGKPDWSPDGTRLVFASDLQGTGVYVVDVDGNGLLKIADTVAPVFESSPVWSPDPVPGAGENRYRIAFTDRVASDASNDLYLIDPDGSDRTRLTGTEAMHYETTPSWSPDATRLVYRVFDETDPSTSRDLWGHYELASGVATVRRHQGALQGASVANPDWSGTHGDEIVWEALGDVWIVDLGDLANPARLTVTADLAERLPSWSPDGTEIVLTSLQLGKKGKPTLRIEIVSATDGTVRRTIVEGSGIGVAWRR